jgi:hypothetical protein
LFVRIDGRARDGDDRADVEGEELLGVRRLEGNHVHEQVEAVRDRERSLFVAIEHDDLLALARMERRDGYVPAVARERALDRAADAARPADDEGAFRR